MDSSDDLPGEAEAGGARPFELVGKLSVFQATFIPHLLHSTLMTAVRRVAVPRRPD